MHPGRPNEFEKDARLVIGIRAPVKCKMRVELGIHAGLQTPDSMM